MRERSRAEAQAELAHGLSDRAFLGEQIHRDGLGDRDDRARFGNSQQGAPNQQFVDAMRSSGAEAGNRPQRDGRDGIRD